MTAAFLVDFAEGVGFQLPAIPETQQSMLRELSAQVQEEHRRRGANAEQASKAREVFLSGLGVGATAERLRSEAKQWWADNWKTVAWAAAGAVVMGAAGAIAAAALASGRGRRSSETTGTEEG